MLLQSFLRKIIFYSKWVYIVHIRKLEQVYSVFTFKYRTIFKPFLRSTKFIFNNRDNNRTEDGTSLEYKKRTVETIIVN